MNPENKSTVGGTDLVPPTPVPVAGRKPRLVRVRSEIKEFTVRVDQIYWDLAQSWLNKNPHVKYLAVLEKATNWHFQIVLRCTENQRDAMGKAIIQAKGHKNGKGGFTTPGNKYKSCFAYVCKGLGKYGDKDNPPDTYHTNIAEITPEKIKEYHATWFREYAHTVGVTIPGEGGFSRKRPRETVFKRLMDHCVENYDLVLPNDHLTKRQRRTISFDEAYDLSTTYYNDDTRLAGHLTRKKAIEEMLIRYGEAWCSNFRKTNMRESIFK